MGNVALLCIVGINRQQPGNHPVPADHACAVWRVGGNVMSLRAASSPRPELVEGRAKHTKPCFDKLSTGLE
jgi:hypothetical protein